MKNFIKLIKENNLIIDVLNVLAGLLLIITLVLFCLFPGNRIVIGLMILVAGIMNIGNGLKRYQDKRMKGLGISLITLGICIFVIGIYMLNVL